MPEWRLIYGPGTDGMPRTGTQGWRQFAGARKKLLGEYDQAKEQATAHEAQVWHGKAGEAWVRNWLQTEAVRLPHFDVIIYDQLEAPVLWVESSPDQSHAGSAQAIPVEFVKAVIEVKATFNTRTVSDAIEHLDDLAPLLRVDRPEAPQKRYLPQRFFTLVIFFELRQSARNNWSALSQFVEETRIIWPGGLILRGEGLSADLSATIGYNYNSSDPSAPLPRVGQDLLQMFTLSESKPARGQQWATRVQWSPIEFAGFAFDLLAMLKGRYVAGQRSSDYGLSWVDYSKGSSDAT